MNQQRTRRSPRPALLALAGLLILLPGAASATPVTHTVNGSLSGLSADVYAELSIVANRASGGMDSGTATVNGQLASTPTGSVDVDWGDPGWSGSLDVAPGDVNVTNPSPGMAQGTATLNLFSLIDIDFDLTVNVDSIDIGLASAFSAPTNPAPPGPGPWNGMDTVDVLLGAQLDFSAVGPFGVTLGQDDIVVGPSAVAGIDIMGTLSRLGGDPGTGSRIELPFSGLSISLPPQDTTNVGTPGCEVPLGFVCLLDITSVDVQITELTLSNIEGTIVADSSTVIASAPEPAVLAMLALPLAWIGVRRPR